ncbi:MAG: hypothetical protein IPM57_07485 [Oligoflexia bacterium]|nr:hypothetical protein [Oligoflexia bacterium]
MNKKYLRVLSTVFHICLYAAAGVAAPLIFKNVGDRRLAGFMAGGLFAIVALRAVKLSLVRPYAKPIRRFFIGYLLLLVFFWVWRFLDSRYLGEILIFGINAYWLHHFFTSLYAISFLLLIYSEVSTLVRTLKAP